MATRLSVLALGSALLLAGLVAGEQDEGVGLLYRYRLEDARRAAEIFEARLAKDPGSFEAQLGAALALNQILAVRTNGNLPLIEGLQDTEANRALWTDLGGRALGYARKAVAQRPDDILAASALATAYMFYASSLGILRSIVQGAGGEYRSNAERLIELDPGYDDAMGHTLLASLYLVAPWPIGDDEAALEHYERALALAPSSVRNQYGLGVYWVRQDRPKRARPYFERAVSLPCTENSEQLFCDWMKQESKRVLATLGAG